MRFLLRISFQFDGGLFPERLDIIILAFFGSENMHDNITIVDKHPLCLRVAFGMVFTQTSLLAVDQQPIRNGFNMSVGGAATDYKVIGQQGPCTDLDYLDVLGLLLVKYSKDYIQLLLSFDNIDSSYNFKLSTFSLNRQLNRQSFTNRCNFFRQSQ